MLKQLLLSLSFGAAMVKVFPTNNWDTVIPSIEPNTDIILADGIYTTRGYVGGEGDVDLKEGQHIIGNKRSILKLDKSIYGDRQVSVLVGHANGICVSNLIVDVSCNGTEQTTKIGLFLGGSDCVADGDTVCNIGGNFTNRCESFALQVGQAFGGLAPSTHGSVINNCLVTNCFNYVSAINLQGKGKMVNNKVMFPYLTDESKRQQFQGLLFCDTYDSMASNNIVVGGMNGCYTDTANNTNLTLCNNTFRGVMNAVWLCGNSSTIDGLHILNNSMLLSVSYPNYPHGGVHLANEADIYHIYRNIDIKDNTITFIKNLTRSGFAYPVYAYNLWTANPDATNFYGVTISGNTVNKSFVLFSNVKDLTYAQ